jgi:hypothetical protein
MDTLRPAVLCLLLLAADALAGPAAPLTVSPAEQSARDIDRLRILRDELASEQSKADDSAKRRAERLAAGDATGVQEAEQALARATDNLAVLRREIQSASAPPVEPSKRLATSAAAPTLPRPSSWWDVYAKPAAR